MKEIQDKSMYIRLNKEAIEKISSNAQKLGVTKSAYIRMLALLDIEVVEDIVGRDILYLNPYFFRLLDYELNRYGNNLNQAVHALHIIKLYCIEKRIGTRGISTSLALIARTVEQTLNKLYEVDEKIAEISRSSYCIGTYEVR